MTGMANSHATPPLEAASPQPVTDLPVAALQPDQKVTEHAAELEDEEDEGLSDAGGASSTSRPDSAEKEEGEIDGGDGDQLASAPPLPGEPVPGSSSGPPLPNEPVPQADDGWDCLWDPNTQAWFFHNRFTGNTQWENPRAPQSSAADFAVASSTASPAPAPTLAPATALSAPAPAPAPPAPAPAPAPASASASAPTASADAIVGGYNPAIHGDYDPNAWYAQKYAQPDEPHPVIVPEIPSLEDDVHLATAGFNRFTGHFQQPDAGPGRHADEAKSKRQMNAYFDVDAVANADDGRSLKAERSNKRISKSELKAFKERRRARKEEKRRAWLRD
ncbi:hypothetical protein E4U41_004772 [Claviceps citrina]|nr:hypothetical protein E4U41_004772 [Claviceps citrina]